MPLFLQPANEFDKAETWRKLKSSIGEIQNHHSNLLSYEENYRYAYNMVLFKQVRMHLSMCC